MVRDNLTEDVVSWGLKEKWGSLGQNNNWHLVILVWPRVTCFCVYYFKTWEHPCKADFNYIIFPRPRKHLVASSLVSSGVSSSNSDQSGFQVYPILVRPHVPERRMGQFPFTQEEEHGQREAWHRSLQVFWYVVGNCEKWGWRRGLHYEEYSKWILQYWIWI